MNMIRTNIRGGKYSNIFEYPNIRHTMTQRSQSNPSYITYSSRAEKGKIKLQCKDKQCKIWPI